MRAFPSARILVVDDHELNRKLLQRLLGIEGYEVSAADCVASAEQAIAEIDPILIVLDLQLPDGDGVDLARKLKTELGADCPTIVACTAGVMDGDEQRALRGGCDAYVAKPIDARSFAELIASLLPEGSRPTSPQCAA
jgi:two-component system, cell cycle response regulator DivK